NRLLVFVAQRNDTAEPVTPESIHRVGTVGAIHQMARMPDGGVRAMVQGIERVRLLDFVAKDPYLVARIEPAREPTVAGPEVDGLRRAVLDLFRRLAEVSSDLPDELAITAESRVEPRPVGYFVASPVRTDRAEARREAERELKRLAGMQPGSPERGMIVTYLEWMASLPWSKVDGGTIDIRRAREVLDEDHFDLDKIKDRILEYLAVRKLRQERG